MTLDKAEAARRQLGTALQLFIDDMDPVSVHVLVSGAMELAHGLAKEAGKPTFRSIVTQDNTDLTEETYERLRKQYWNGFKHFSDQKGKSRDDAHLLADFGDGANIMPLLIGWQDWGTATGHMPIAAQCFQAWVFAVFPDMLKPNARLDGLDDIFPNIRLKKRADQKADLRRVIRKYRRDKELWDHPKTERRKLLLPNNRD